MKMYIKSIHRQLWQIIIKGNAKNISSKEDWDEEDYNKMPLRTNLGICLFVHFSKMNIRKCAG